MTNEERACIIGLLRICRLQQRISPAETRIFPCPSRWSPIIGSRRVSKAVPAWARGQRAAVLRFAEAEGFDVAAELTEIETGKGSDALDRRPQLSAALAEARRQGKGTPVAVAKLDRLSRDVHFISGLMSHKTPILVADLGPDVEPFLLHLARRTGGEGALADLHPHQGGARGRQGARADAWRPEPQGGPGDRPAAHKADADAHADAVMPMIREAQAAGAKTLRAIAAALNGRGVATARGGKWEAATVRNILRRPA